MFLGSPRQERNCSEISAIPTILPATMRYFDAYRFAFESPKWGIQLLIATVCQFVPIVGPMVLLGYLYSVVEAKHRHGANQFPDFNFDRLGAYLSRGAWTFLAQLVSTLPAFILFIPVFIAIFVSTAVVGQSGSRNPPGFVIPLVIVGFLVFAIVMFAVQFLSIPIVLKAGLSQDFAAAFSLQYIRDFLSRVWKEQILAMLFLMVTAPFVALAGLLLLIVGIYPAATVIGFAQVHLHYQLYELYLQRGGTPIPLKDSAR